MAESITAQLLLAVRAREAFRTETDSVVAPKVSNVFPGASQQSMKLRRAAYVTQKKKEENKIEEEELAKQNEIQIASSLQSVLSAPAPEDVEPEVDTAANGDESAASWRQSSIHEEYNLLLSSIKSVKAQVERLKLLLIRAKLLTMDSATSSVEAIRLEYLSSRLMRLRQLNVIPNNSDRKAEARESYFLWCSNQRNLAARKAKLDTEEMRKRGQPPAMQSTPLASFSSPEPKRTKGIGNIFGSEDGGRHVKFTSVDLMDGGDRRSSFLGLPETAVLPDPLSRGETSMLQAMEEAGEVVMRRHRAHLAELRKMDGLHVPGLTAAVAAAPPSAPAASSAAERQAQMQPPADEPSPSRTARSVSFCASTKADEPPSPPAPGRSLQSGLPLSSDFVSFNFDEEDTTEQPSAPPPLPEVTAIWIESPSTEPARDSAPMTPHTPSAKLQRRFSMSTTKDNFTSFVETKSSSSSSRSEHAVPAAYREVNEDGLAIHNPKMLKMAGILKSLSVSSSAGVTLFEKEVENRMRRCLDFASDAVHNKFVPEGDISKTSKGMDEFSQRISEKESTITNTAEYMKNIGTGIAEGYFHQIKDAHQLVLQAQLTRLERLQSRFPAAPGAAAPDENDDDNRQSEDLED